MSSQVYDYAERYSKMTDEELLRIDGDKQSLLDEAKLALEKELQLRMITNAASQPRNSELTECASNPSHRQAGSSRWVRLGIFVILGIASGVTIALAFHSKLNPKAEEILGQMSVFFALAGWGITEVIAGRWLTLKRTWTIAIIMYLVELTWIALKI